MIDAAADAFTEAMGLGFVVAGACALIAALAVKLWLPAGHQPHAARIVPLPRDPGIQEQAV